MSQPVNREGTFRVEPVDWHTSRSQTGAMSLVVNYLITAQFDPETKSWVDWSKYDMGIVGWHYLIQKNGSLNERTVENVIQALGWSGVFTDLSLESTKLTRCQIEIKNETYNGTTSLKVKWINKWDSVPGGNTASDDDLKGFDTQFGAQLRAMRGNVARNEVSAPASDAEGIPF